MRLQDLTEMGKLKGEKGHDHFVTNIEKDAVKNKNYRKVLFTSKQLQVVLMSIPPKGDIGTETHPDIDQFIRVEEGEGKIILNGKERAVSKGFAFVIPQGTEHEVINTSESEDLSLYTIYAPPHHQKDVVRKTKADAEDPKRKEEFDGKTDVA